ncbi:aspartate kinase [Leuconostoc citreum]|uniref:aspartate kinase n=1 Tax=Leuconostoc citreum TaxID=33964 RepID=UPI002A807C44|nr:aspartate kinase [Leuconostoc citreum]MDY5162384.1 aspartate kinase [Leuconostoc citreum]MDY5165954.1 aspartate kinase [Leuconostoc citreum]
MKVSKFGGSSLADGHQLQRVFNIVNADSNRKIIVVSAPGKRFTDDIKVTDLLIKYAAATINDQNTETIISDIKQRYHDIADHFGLPQASLTDIDQQIDHLAKKHYRSFDYLFAAFAAHGEYLNAQLIAKVFTYLGLPARFIDPKEIGLLVDDNARSATFNTQSYETIAKLDLSTSERLIIPGFFGYTNNGDMATFSRGGSDITGAIMARALSADLYENFTDVSAIYAVNPNIITHPAAIHQMTYDEMRELSYAGFAVFHDEAIIPAIQGGIRINIKNTNDPDAPGTFIVPPTEVQETRPVTGIANSNRFAALYLHRYLLNKEVGFTLRILEILKRHNISYEHMPSGIDDLTIIFDKTNLSQDKVDAMLADIATDIKPDTLKWLPSYGIIMIVGEGMRNRIGALTEIVTPLKENGISLQMVNQGASEISIMLGIQPDLADSAVKAIYNNIFKIE